jgi:type IV pilus assembly protein PilO
MAEIIPKDRRGQTLLFLTIFAAAMLYFVWSGTPVGGVPGISQLNVRRDSFQRALDSIQTQVRSAQRDVRAGAVAQLERALAEYRASLDLMRQLVPASEEVPNLLDDVSSRAKVRGANVVNFVPQPLESGTPFDTKRVRVTVTGEYDQIGEFLSDVASLQRIIVPQDLQITRINSPTADSALRARQLLQASFQIRTYVKQRVPESPPAAAGARPAAPAAAAPAGSAR